MSSTKIIAGFIAGAVSGAIAGILFAPDSGANTRNKIMKKPGNIKDAVKNSVNELAEHHHEEESITHDSGSDKIRQVMHHAKEIQE